MEERPGCLRIFLAFLRLGLTAFGGPAMVRYIRELVCSRNQWVRDEDFDHGIALVQTIPGATAMQAAAYAGLKSRGGAGAVAAFTGFALPAFVLMVVLAWVYRKAVDIAAVVSCFSGLKVVVVAIVANATVDFGKKMLRTWQDVLLMALSAMFLFMKGSPVTVIALSAAAGVLLYRRYEGSGVGGVPLSEALSSSEARDALRWAGMVAFTAAAVMAVLSVARPALFRLCLIMMKVDFFAYGGGYASLPLMLHEIVEKRAFLEKTVFMDGIALGQVTPGPIVITAAFVGFMLQGLTGALLCAWAIFTPSLFMLMSVSPFFDSFKHAPLFRRAMRGVLSSFVGLLLAVFLSFVTAIHWGLWEVLIGGGSFYALFRGVDILYVVVAAAALSSVLL